MNIKIVEPESLDIYFGEVSVYTCCVIMGNLYMRTHVMTPKTGEVYNSNFTNVDGCVNAINITERKPVWVDDDTLVEALVKDMTVDITTEKHW